MSNFIYYEDNTPINMDKCTSIEKAGAERFYSIIFSDGNNKISWLFEGQEKRDNIFERIKYYYAKDIEHVKDKAKRLDE